MTLMERNDTVVEGEAFGDVLCEIRDVASSWRNVERTMQRRTGERLSSTYLAWLANGEREAPYEAVLKIARTYPEFAGRLFASRGMPLPDEFRPEIPEDLVQAQREMAQWRADAVEVIARRRNLATSDVIKTLIVEELERTGGGA